MKHTANQDGPQLGSFGREATEDADAKVIVIAAGIAHFETHRHAAEYPAERARAFSIRQLLLKPTRTLST